MNEIVKDIESNGIISLNEADEKGMSKSQFYRCVASLNLEKVAPGIYAKSDELVDDLFLLHKRCPQAIFSHEEAYLFHDLTDREPIQNTLTVYSGYNAHRLKSSFNCKVYSVKKELLNVGKIMVEDAFGYKIPMYDLERTICDLIRNRNQMEIDEFKAILNTYINRNNKDFTRLFHYAKLFRIEKVMRTYMEVLV